MPTFPSDNLSAVESEKVLLGSVLLGRDLPQTALAPDDFSLDAHRRVFLAMWRLRDRSVPLDIITLRSELQASRELEQVGEGCIASLTDGLPLNVNLEHHAKVIAEKAAVRRFLAKLEAVQAQALDGGSLSDLAARVPELDECLRDEWTHSIRAFADVPDIFEADIPAPSYIVPGLIPEGSLILLAGEPGIGKSYLVQRLAVSCAMGTRFLGYDCTRTAALYLDRENPGGIVKERVAKMAGGAIPGLKFWGGWLQDPVPDLGDPRLLAIAKKEKPLIVVDSLIRFHDGEENSATDMSKVLAKLRALANAGATVLTIHHRGKGENAADYRGSSDIGGGPDVVFSLTRDDSGLLTLRSVKNRFGADVSLTIKPDYADGTFALTDSPAVVGRRQNDSILADIIAAQPGINTTAIIEAAKQTIGKNATLELLQNGAGKMWRSESGPRNSKRYFPLSECSTANYAPEHSFQATSTTGRNAR